MSRVGRALSEEQRALAAEINNTLDACEVAHGVIAFEDVHRVDDPAYFAFLDLIERLSPRWSVAITSRTEPPLALARLRARDELAEFRQPQRSSGRHPLRAAAQAADHNRKVNRPPRSPVFSEPRRRSVQARR